MSEKRRDNRGRILHNGEVQLSDGRYRFKYLDAMGKERYAYSWRLNRNDATPDGKRHTLSLREMEKEIQAACCDGITPSGGNMTVLELVEKYISTKTGVRPTTKTGYKTVTNLLKNDPFGKKRIDSVRLSDAKYWFIHLQKGGTRGYGSINFIRGILRPAFQLAVDDDLIRKNPFQFKLTEIIVNDMGKRESISNDEERKFLKFVKEDPYFCEYYDGIYVLFKTGLRISEFCGLTISDIDFKEHAINIDHQLRKSPKDGYYIQKTKTSSGMRKIPMTPDVEACFKRIIKNRKPPKEELIVDGKSGFLYFDRNGNPCHSLHWDSYFRSIVLKYNKTHKVQMPNVTPHVCRHTYCSNMAKQGINPKILQYLMGHSNIGVTMNIYTHVNFEDVKKEVSEI